MFLMVLDPLLIYSIKNDILILMEELSLHLIIYKIYTTAEKFTREVS